MVQKTTFFFSFLIKLFQTTLYHDLYLVVPTVNSAPFSYYKLRSSYCKLGSSYCKLGSSYCELCSPYCKLCSPYCKHAPPTVNPAPPTVNSAPPTVNSAPPTVNVYSRRSKFSVGRRIMHQKILSLSAYYTIYTVHTKKNFEKNCY